VIDLKYSSHLRDLGVGQPGISLADVDQTIAALVVDGEGVVG
jgi:hypothetical protein